MHPSSAIRSNTSTHLEGQRIALAVTGSIAAVQTVKLARELIRHGADVVPVASSAACEIIHPNALEFATGHGPVTQLTGQVEHLMAAREDVDAVLMAPATANSVAKVALAIDDTPVTSLVSSSMGSAPVMIAPAMHEEMLDNPKTAEHLAALEDRGATIIDPYHEEDEAKMASIEVLTEHVIRELGASPLAGKRVLVVNGSTIEGIDDMRVITNRSTGRTGAAMARQAYRLGADVDLWFGHGHVELPETVPVERFVTVSDLIEKAPEASRYDWVLMPAAISDFSGEPAEGKVSSDEPRELTLTPTQKVLPKLREVLDDGQRLIGFKAESAVTEDELKQIADRFCKENKLDAVVANRLSEVDVDTTRVHLVTEGSERTVEGSKNQVAREVLTTLAEVL